MMSVGTDSWMMECPQPPNFTLIKGDPQKQGLQYFEIPCGENGEHAWIEISDALFSDSDITQGVVKGYGQIATE